MIEFIAIVVLLVVVWGFLKFRKKSSPNVAKNAAESAKPIKQAPTVDKVATAADVITTQTNEKVAPSSTTTTSQPVTQTVTIEHKQPVTAQATNSLLPQDSMLRRHYVTHLRAMITSLSPSRPSDLALSRHYDTQIAASIAQCVSNEAAMEKLINAYENHQKTSACPAIVSQPVTVADVIIEESKTEPSVQIETASESSAVVSQTTDVVEPVVEESKIEPSVQIETVTERPAVAAQHSMSKVPEDSMLKRHYLSHLYTQVAATLPTRPTDSTLRRHYDAMLESEVKNQLN